LGAEGYSHLIVVGSSEWGPSGNAALSCGGQENAHGVEDGAAFERLAREKKARATATSIRIILRESEERLASSGRTGGFYGSGKEGGG